MDIRMNKAEFRSQVENIRRTKRVRKPNKEESEQNQNAFKDEYEQIAKEDDAEQQKKKENKSKPGKQDKSLGNPQNATHPDADSDGKLGKHIDIRV